VPRTLSIAVVAIVLSTFAPEAAFGATVPTNALLVQVTAGASSTGINATLKLGGAIAGTVTANADGAGLGNINVRVLTRSGDDVADTGTEDDGSYVISGLVPSKSYYVCFSAGLATGGSAPAGYLDSCFGATTWTGGKPTTGSTPVAVVAGSTTMINQSLASAGGISGTASTAGVGVFEVDVEVFQGTTFVANASTDAAGSFLVPQLKAASNYKVCFDGRYTGGSATGFLPVCYKKASWDGSSVPTGASSVSVSAGSVTAGVNMTLPAGAAIAGHATVGTGASVVRNAEVLVYSVAGGTLATGYSYATTGTDGSYQLNSIPGSAAGYQVCFDTASARTTGAGYASQCTGGAAWNGAYPPPTPATPIAVTPGTVTAGVDAHLARGGAVSGTVTSTGVPLTDVAISVIDSAGDVVGGGVTAADGTYIVRNLSPETDYVCFDGSYAHSDSLGATSFAMTCYGGGDWDGGAPTPSATPLNITANSTTAGTSVDLGAIGPPPPPNGTITGKIAFAGNHLSPSGTTVIVYDPTGTQIVYNSAFSNTYSIDAPANATGYVVCFNPTTAFNGAGYEGQCYKNVAWNSQPASNGGLANTGVTASRQILLGLAIGLLGCGFVCLGRRRTTR